MSKRGKFYLDKANGKILGVCSGLAAATGIDATIIRIAFVVATLVGGFPWTVIAYVAAGLIGKQQGRTYASQEDFAPPSMSAHRFKETTRDIDRRLAEVETYVTTRNSSLEREIESLR
jgi:phage shock protein C